VSVDHIFCDGKTQTVPPTFGGAEWLKEVRRDIGREPLALILGL